MQYRLLKCESIQYRDIVPNIRDGDLILFKACDNLNVLVHGSYFSHIGMVVHIDGVPHMFEANNPTGMNLLPHHNPAGIFLTPLYERVSKYRGYCYVRHLNKKLTDEHLVLLLKFIRFAVDNMYYDKAVVRSGFACLFGKPCSKKTNCGQILFLALIAMGLLPFEYYRKSILHHLMYISNLRQLQDGYEYGDIIRIVDQPFAR